MPKKMKKAWSLALIALALMSLLTASFAAAEQLGSIKIQIAPEKVDTYEGLKVAIYRVATPDPTVQGGWKIDVMYQYLEFLNLNVHGVQYENIAEKLEHMVAKEFDDAYEELIHTIKEGDIPNDGVAIADENGILQFRNLQPGIYFGNLLEGVGDINVVNFLTVLPMRDPTGETDELIYEIDVKPKVEHLEPTSTPNVTTEPPIIPGPGGPTPTPLPTPRPTPPIPTPTPGIPTLTVEYIVIDGLVPPPPPHIEQLSPGTPYYVPSPSLPGYEPNRPVVRGTMPPHDWTETVIYFPQGGDNPEVIDINEYETPLGLGEIIMHVGVCYE